MDLSKYLEERCSDPVLAETLTEHHPWLSKVSVDAGGYVCLVIDHDS